MMRPDPIGALDGQQIPAAFRRVPIRQGSTIRIKAQRNDPPPRLIVEGSDGTDVLTITVTPDGQLDAHYDPARITEAARLLLLEARQLLGLTPNAPFVRVAAESPSPSTPNP